MSAGEVTDSLNGWGPARTKSVSWHDPAVLAAAGSSLTGRELLEGILSGQLPPPPMAALIGAEIVSVDEGDVVFRCTPDQSTYNPLGVVHGGLLCTMLDTAAGCAVQTLLPAGVRYASIEIKVSFLEPLRAGAGAIEVRGRVLKVGRRVAFAEADARDGTGELVGQATTSIAIGRRELAA
jgi:uncharacterized protein (TIGR00369 family)